VLSVTGYNFTAFPLHLARHVAVAPQHGDSIATIDMIDYYNVTIPDASYVRRSDVDEILILCSFDGRLQS